MEEPSEEARAELLDERTAKRPRSEPALEAELRSLSASAPRPPHDWQSWAFVPISPEGVRAFTEPSALSRAEKLLESAESAEAGGAADGPQLVIEHDEDARSLRLSSRFPDGPLAIASLHRRDVDGEAGAAGGFVCSAIACTVDACRGSLGLCPHAAAALLRLAARPEILDGNEQVPPAPP
eukprot:tig00000093_g3643.t1